MIFQSAIVLRATGLWKSPHVLTAMRRRPETVLSVSVLSVARLAKPQLCSERTLRDIYTLSAPRCILNQWRKILNGASSFMSLNFQTKHSYSYNTHSTNCRFLHSLTSIFSGAGALLHRKSAPARIDLAGALFVSGVERAVLIHRCPPKSVPAHTSPHRR